MTAVDIHHHADIAPAVMAIRNAVHDEARTERWPQDQLRQETRDRLRRLAADLRQLGRDGHADFIDRHYPE